MANIISAAGCGRRTSQTSCFKFAVYCLIFILFLILAVNAEKEPIEEDDQDSKQISSETVEEHGKTAKISSTQGAKTHDLGFFHAFIASFSVIIVSELGDKTFFIAAIMAMRHSRLAVLLGACGALFLMTVISALFGWITIIIPRVYTYYISTALFAIFGLKMLKEGYYMSPNEGQEEFEEVQSDLKKKEDELASETLDTEAGAPVIRGGLRNRILSLVSRVFLQSFTLTFLAEWGDRSQLATIILAAREDVVGVSLGAFVGHSICTALAVLGGRMIAQRISVRTVTLVGGVVFLVFAVSALFIDTES